MAHTQHHTEENPKVSSTAAFFFIIIIAGLVLAGINFVKSMSHSDGHSNHEVTAHNDMHTNSWHHPHQYNTKEMTTNKTAEPKAEGLPHPVMNVNVAEGSAMGVDTIKIKDTTK